MKKIIIITIVWLILVNLFALLALNRFVLEPDTAYEWIDPAKVQQVQSWNIVDLHARWDSFWYLDIIKNGYSYTAGDLSNLVFFPLYPLLVKFVSLFMPGKVLAGWIVSIFSLIGAVAVFYRLVKKFHIDISASEAVFLLLIFPTAFFYNALYTESLFLLLSLLSFYFFLGKDFFKGGIFGFLAGLTRVTGILLFVPAAIEYVRVHGWKVKKELFNLLLIPLGTAGFIIFHWIKFGDPFLFFRIESTWGRNFALNADHFVLANSPATANLVLDAFFVLFAIICAIYVILRLRASYGWYMLATIAVALSSGTLMSINRYILVLFPIALLGASVKNQLVKNIWITTSILLMGLYITLFVNNYWAG